MNRRLAGAVVLVVALVAVMVLPSVAGRRIEGAPVASTFPAAPQVGDCLLGLLPEDSLSFGLPPEIPVTAASFGPCGESIGGEVVAFWSTEAAAEQAPRSRIGGPCYRQAAEYAGLQQFGRSTDLPDAPSGGPVSWKPTIGMDGILVVPGVREQNAGRSWRACLAVPVAREFYQGSLREAYTSGTMPDDFGLCWQGVDMDMMPSLVSCGEPHPAELLATGYIRNRLDAPTEVIESSCVQIAARIMHTDDPTRGGVLRVVADRLTGGSMTRDDSPLTISCFVETAGPRQLVGTVIGLGGDPVPFRT